MSGSMGDVGVGSYFQEQGQGLPITSIFNSDDGNLSLVTRV